MNESSDPISVIPLSTENGARTLNAVGNKGSIRGI